jgi:hypothetical protein
LPWFAELNRSLEDPLDDNAFRLRLKQAEERLRALALELLERATGEYTALDGTRLRALLNAGGRPVPVYAPMLFPATAALEAAAA